MIQSMKKAKIVFLKDDLEAILKEIQLSQCFMIVDQEENANHFISVDGLIQQAETELKVLKKYEKKKIFSKAFVASFDELEDAKNKLAKIVTDLEAINKKSLDLKNSINDLKAQKQSLMPFKNLSIKMNEVKDTKSCNVSLGYLPFKELEELKKVCAEHNAYLEIFDQVKLEQAVLVINYKTDVEVGDFLKNKGFQAFNIPEYDGMVEGFIDDLEKKQEELELELEKNLDYLKTNQDDINKIKLYIDSLNSYKERKEVAYGETSSVYYLDGWVPANMVKKLTDAVEKVTSYYDIELFDPEPDDDVPTYTVNNKFVTPFESITNMFSVPSWKEFDPNPVMSVWYWLLFGMMMGDFGYGAVLLVGTLLFLKFMHPKKGTKSIAKVLMFSSIPTMIWGIIFNSYFGASLPFYKAIVSPMEDAMAMLILSIVMGALHILTGLIFKAYTDIRRKDIFELLSKDLSWIFILVGIGAFAVSMVKVAALKIPSIILIILGALLIIVFGGAKKKKVMGKIFGGIVGLYDITGYLGDLLSYSRIMALVMSSASVAFVMNTLAGMVQGNIAGNIASVLIYIVGHLFNLVLGLLSAYVHDCRLQYIEFYGKFYEGGGTLFTPLAPQVKYVDELNIEEEKADEVLEEETEVKKSLTEEEKKKINENLNKHLSNGRSIIDSHKGARQLERIKRR